MSSLSAEQLAFLNRYGFDAALLENWRAGVRAGTLSLEGNAVTGPVLAPPPGSILDLPRRDSQAATEAEELGRAAIARGELGVVILNGGMATRFGGVVKGVVPALGDKSFLGLRLLDVGRVQRHFGGTVQVLVMNSFATEETTRAHLQEHDYFGLAPEQVAMFNQFTSVRMRRDGELFRGTDGNASPYGTGHGDFQPALRASGALSAFLAGGGKHLFVANVDNLGARISPLLLGLHVRAEAEATVELAPKWPGDVGGAPFLAEGKLQLIEQLRYPPGFDPDIVDVFNTNTFHFRAEALDREFGLRWYYVQKKVDDQQVVQIERLIGEMTRFLESQFVRVKRTGPDNRFFPIKVPDDLEGGRDEIAAMYRDV